MTENDGICPPIHITVVGTGYVGLVSAACFAHLGHAVAAVDSDAAKVRSLQAGAVPIFEDGLQALLVHGVREGRLGFTSDLAGAVHGTDLVVIAVGTPADALGAADLSALETVVGQLGAVLSHPVTVAIKSTVPVGTCDGARDALQEALRRRGVSWAVPVVSNPEFLREGTAADDFLHPDRIVVGVRHAAEAALLRRAFGPLVRAGVPLLTLSTRSAELSKYAANTMLAARISFINEMADIAEATGADIEEVRQVVGADVRIGPQFLRAGIGYGGSCFPKDVSSLAHAARAHGVAPEMLQAVARTNDRHHRWPVRRLAQAYGGGTGLRGLRVAVWGLSFKPGTDDLRDAPSLVVIRELLDAGAGVSAYDPVALRHAVTLVPPHGRLEWAPSASAALDGCDVLVLLTEWREFIDFPPDRVAAALRDGLVLDGRNVLPVARWVACGLRVWQVGRPQAGPALGGDAPAATPWLEAAGHRGPPPRAAGTT